MLHKRVTETTATRRSACNAAELSTALVALSRLLLVPSFRGELPEAEFKQSVAEHVADDGGDAVSTLLREGFVVRRRRGGMELLGLTMPGAGSVVRQCAEIVLVDSQNSRRQRGLGPGSMERFMFHPLCKPQNAKGKQQCHGCVL
jgi:hypothetical protein